MCDPVSIGTALVGIVASQALAPKAPKTPDVPAVAAPPQAAKTPDQRAVRAGQAAAAGGATAGPSSTMLTGLGGVAPGALNLGKNVLLGQ